MATTFGARTNSFHTVTFTQQEKIREEGAGSKLRRIFFQVPINTRYNDTVMTQKCNVSRLSVYQV